MCFHRDLLLSVDIFSYFRIYEKFTIHSDLSKAASWKRLTTEFLNASLPSVEKIKVTLGCKLSILCSFFRV